MNLGLSGQKALITGADSGIGLHTARELLAEGATVFLTDRKPAPLEEAATALDAPGGDHLRRAS